MRQRRRRLRLRIGGSIVGMSDLHHGHGNENGK
jgi:hypothetical protein